MLKKPIILAFIISSISFVIVIVQMLLYPRLIGPLDFILPAIILGLVNATKYNEQMPKDLLPKVAWYSTFIDIGFFFALFVIIVYLASLELLKLIFIIFILLILGSIIRRKILLCLFEVVIIPLLVMLFAKILNEGGIWFKYRMFEPVITILLPFFLLLIIIYTGKDLFSEKNENLE